MLRARSRRNVVSLLCLIGIAIQSFGCMTISEKFLDQEYYLIEPSAKSLGAGAVSCAGKTGPSTPYEPVIKASDALVMVYTDCIKKMLRRRMNLARVARLTSSTFAVLTAAAAAALGATAAAPLTAITALAATSAVIPEFMRIFGADERAKAYDEGVHLIEEAEGNYLLAHATGTNSSGIISPNVLTREGAQLYVQVVASVKLVEQLLVAQLPKVEDIQRAQGRIALRTLDVSTPSTTTLVPKQAVSVSVGGGVPPYEAKPVGTEAAKALTVPKDPNPSNVFTIEAKDTAPPGRYEVGFSDAANGSAALTFTVTVAVSPVTLRLTPIPHGRALQIKAGDPIDFIDFLVEGGASPYTVTEITSPLVTDTQVGQKLTQPTIRVTAPKATDAREYTIKVQDDAKNETSAKISVVAAVAPVVLTSELVRKVQTALKTKGFDLGKFGVDGQYGPDTKKAVQKFKRLVKWPNELDELDADLLKTLGVE